jgi:hypothetical protein
MHKPAQAGAECAPPTERPPPPPPSPVGARRQTSTASRGTASTKRRCRLGAPSVQMRGSCRHFGSRSSVWCVLEAELVAHLAGAVLRAGDLEQLVPHSTRRCRQRRSVSCPIRRSSEPSEWCGAAFSSVEASGDCAQYSFLAAFSEVSITTHLLALGRGA